MAAEQFGPYSLEALIDMRLVATCGDDFGYQLRLCILLCGHVGTRWTSRAT